MQDYCQFSDLVGKVFSKVVSDNDSVTFYLNERDYYKLEHQQDCCESVWLEDVCGDLFDLENTPIVVAEAASNPPGYENAEDDWGVCQYTFYHLRTNKGTVTLRFCGTSNGYYSVGVSLHHYYPSKDEDDYSIPFTAAVAASDTFAAIEEKDSSLDGKVMEIEGKRYRLTQIG